MTNRLTEPTACRFGSFLLDLDQGALFAADGTELPLRPKSFALLCLLVENAGRLLSCATIMDALWPNSFVTDNSINQCIHEIRTALGPEAPEMLRTLPRRGYRLTAEVRAESSALSPRTVSSSAEPAQPSQTAPRVGSRSVDTQTFRNTSFLFHHRFKTRAAACDHIGSRQKSSGATRDDPVHNKPATVKRSST